MFIPEPIMMASQCTVVTALASLTSSLQNGGSHAGPQNHMIENSGGGVGVRRKSWGAVIRKGNKNRVKSTLTRTLHPLCLHFLISKTKGAPCLSPHNLVVSALAKDLPWARGEL